MKRYKYIVSLIILLVAVTSWAEAQGQQNVYVSSAENWHKQAVKVVEKGTSLEHVLSMIESEYKVNFLFDSRLLDDKNLSSQRVLNFDQGLFVLLDDILAEYDVIYKKLTHRTLGIVAKPKENNQSDRLEIISGTVTDAQSGETLPAVNVSVKGTTIGISTGNTGRYELNAPSLQDTLVFSFVGYKTKEIPISGRTEIDVELAPQAIEGEEMVVVGYGAQEKASIIGSISDVEVGELKTPTRSLSNSLAGNLAGVVGVQRSGEPGYDDASFWIRGISTFGANKDPLVLVDGVERSLNNIEPEEIKSFNILKDATATAVYGVRGANGVVMVTTKRGNEGKPQIEVKAEQGVSGPTKLPDFVDGATYASLYNEGRVLRGEEPFYSEEAIQKYRNQSEPYLYPSIDWMDALIKDWSTNRRVNMNVSGGGDVARYFVSATYYSENGMFKQSDLGKYDTNIRLNRYNFRANVDVNLHENTKLDLSLGGILVDSNYPGTGTSTIFGSTMRATPVMFPAQYPDGKIPNLESGSAFNPYAQLTQSGFSTEWRNTIQSTISLEQDLSSLTQGLRAQARFSFDAYNQHNIQRHKTPNTWIATGKDEQDSLLYRQTRIGDDYLGFDKQSWGDRAIYIEASANYNRLFGKHSIGGLFLYNQRNFVDAGAGSSIGALPYREQGVAGRGTYSYDDRYYLEFNFGYNGSENFRSGQRFGFFPSLAVGWRASEEEFWEPVLPTVSHLKLKASYGIVGNDEIGGRRFVYMNIVGEGNGGYNFGEDNREVGGRGIEEWGTTNATWEKAKKANVGIELGLFDKIMIHTDAFYERRDGIFMRRRSTPGILGILNEPWANIGTMENMGIDGNIEYTDTFGDLSYTIRGNYTFTQNEILENDEPDWKYEYQNRKGKKYGQQFGLIALGLFENQEEIENWPKQNFGNYQPGDIKYKDINGDGIINSYDEVAIGHSDIPELVYGFGASLRYKNIDFSFLFQGIGRVSTMLGGEGFFPFQQGGNRGNIISKVEKDRWTPNNPDPNATFPRLSVGDVPNNYRASTWWQRDASFIRLKNAEIGFSFPRSWLQGVNIQNVRVYANGFNLLTFSKFDLWDPEMGGGRGAGYPPQSVVNMGINVNF